ncbi:MAG: amino acid ABC transporter ATP-binding protein [Spirochaetota bacterium]
MQILVDDVSKSYDGVQVLADVSLHLDDAHALTIVGPSGGGKTTLLRIIAGLERPDGGEVTVNGRRIVYREDQLREYRKSVGMVFQFYNLFPHLTALDNITLPLEKVHGLEPEEARARAEKLLARFRLLEHAHKRPGQLSGGQKQRIALSRAIAIAPQFLILDEPTSALDPELTAEVLDMIRELRAEDTHLILVTHHMGFARSVSDYVVFVAGGRIAEHGPPARVFDDPADEQVRRFLERILKY